MAKSTRPNARKRKQAARQQAAVSVRLSRRQIMARLGVGALALAGFGGAGLAGAGMYRRYLAEHDLSRIGKGKPAVVQVHDPSCATCTALQRQTRAAMKQFGECDLIYLVADITQPEGQLFARHHNVPHVTLVLLDGGGRAVQVLSGMRERRALEPVLAAHVAAHGVS